MRDRSEFQANVYMDPPRIKEQKTHIGLYAFIPGPRTYEKKRTFFQRLVYMFNKKIK
jgi:hypothetical protein